MEPLIWNCPVCPFKDNNENIVFVHCISKHPLEYIKLKRIGFTKGNG